MSGHLEKIERLDRAFVEAGGEALSKALSAGRPEGVEPITFLIGETVDPDVEVDLTAWDHFAQLWRFRDGRVVNLATFDGWDAAMEAARGQAGG